MMRRGNYLIILFFVLSTFCSGTYFSQSFTGILLNEYSASNTTGPVDAFGSPSDWVELYNPNTFSVSLQSYFLSNDRNNLFKWQFPQNYAIPGGGVTVIWLSGRNTVKNGEYHANFTLDQCKNQWLILSTDVGVVRDSVFIQATMAGHTRGRISAVSNGVANWRLYTTHTFLQTNPSTNNYLGYCPTPSMVVFPNPVNPSPSPSKINVGGFFNEGQSPFVYFKLENNQAYDNQTSCFDIYYTTDGTFPGPGNGILYTDSATGSQGTLLLSLTTMVRAVAYPKQTATCNLNYLPGFCQTNTYFIDAPHNAFSTDFGVLSLAMDPNWFQTSGAFSPTIHAEYYDKKKQLSEGYAQINRPIQETWSTKQKGMYINMDDRQGFGCAFEGNVFNVDLLGTTTRTNFPSLHLKSGDTESNSVPFFAQGGTTSGTGLRDVLIQSIAAKNNLKVNPLHIKPVVTFINGKYYGVYNLYEIYDKHYEQFYYNQSPDSLTLAIYHIADGFVSYPDGTSSSFLNDFDAKIYNEYVTLGKPLSNATNYEKLMSELDKESFMDYMIVNSITMNRDIWNYNVAYAKGGQKHLPGSKWHYYLWNAPAIYNFTGVQSNTNVLNVNGSPCEIFANATTATVSPIRGNSHGVILNRLMDPFTGNKGFQLEYKNRMQDLLNGPFQCDNLKKHIDALYTLYAKEMLYHSDPQTGLQFGTQIPPDVTCWDSLMLAEVVVPSLRKVAGDRCYVVSTTLSKPGCFGLVGPFDITVDVKPDSAAGKVKLNTVVLKDYPWAGKYYSTTMALKAIPSNTAYVFNHWELIYTQNAEDPNDFNRDPLLLDSILYTFNRAENVVAVFTDKTQDISMSGDFSNIPTGFTPNGDQLNDIFRPLGSADYVADYEMLIFSRWGEEVFRSTSVQQGWDGNYKGSPAVTGVYAYVIKYKNVKGENKTATGNVTLTR